MIFPFLLAPGDLSHDSSPALEMVKQCEKYENDIHVAVRARRGGGGGGAGWNGWCFWGHIIIIVFSYRLSHSVVVMSLI